MSLLRRKRRQNRMELRTIPATRETRFSLESVSVRGLRKIIGRKLAELRKSNRPKEETMNEWLDSIDPRSYTYQRLHGFGKEFKHIMNNVKNLPPSRIRKPVSVIQLNGKIRVDLPPEHPICVAREKRREIMFAFGKSGSGGQRPRRQNNDVQLFCKRS